MDDRHPAGLRTANSRRSGSEGALRLWRRAGRRNRLHRSLRAVFERGPVAKRRLAALVVVTLFAGVYLLGDSAPAIFVVPIVLAAIEFGVVGGLAAAMVALALVAGWDLSRPETDLDALEYVSRAVAYLLLGGLLGRFVTSRRRLESKIARSEELSLDLMATADFDGYFTRLNDSWERTLGWSREELRSRPLIEFVHPDDRERTLIEVVNVTAGHHTVSFRNRYRARDGSYRWLEWNACVDTEQPVIHANARDITLLQHAEQTIRHHGERLERIVGERTSELEKSRRETLQRLALAAEYRDDETHDHTARVGHTSMLIARELGLAAETVQTICDAVPLHDVGKVGISDTILLKPGPLTAAEYATMQRHTVIGAAILVDSSSTVLQMAGQVALGHHERWNGSGYPHGATGEEIPIAARITAIADTFDAITHRRPYKDARPIDDALAEILDASGTLFDPTAVDAFLTLDHELLVHDTYA